MYVASWWREPCPKRGPSLTHAHWSSCDPKGVHPVDDTGNEGINHPAVMCCHCERTAEMDMNTIADAPEPEVHDGRKEPKLATGELSGKIDALGRGELTPRQLDRLRFIRRRAMFESWLEENHPEAL